MRRGSWILAVSGMMALNTGAVFADDAAPSQTRGQAPLGGQDQYLPRTGQSKTVTPNSGFPSRYTRGNSTADPAAAKNYYEELFGNDDKPAPTTDSKLPAWAQESAGDEKPAVATPSAASAASAPPAPSTPSAASAASAPTVPKKAPLPPSAPKKVADASESKVIQAGYDRLAGSTDKKMIQQVRSSEDKAPRGSAPPMPELGGSADVPRAASGRISVAPPSRAAQGETGPQTPQVTVEWTKKSDINVGQECQIELHVRNGGTTPASQVTVDTVFPNTVRLTNAEPKPRVDGDKVSWSFDSLAPGAEKTIAIKLIPSRRGELGVTAQVRLTGTASAAFRVEEPLLKVALKGPSEVMLGDPASHLILVSNPGTGTTNDVKVEARLSDGLEHGSRGERLVMDVGSIGPGETRTVRLGLSAIKGGPQSISVTAMSSSDAGATASTQLNVIAPSMKIAVDGPGLRYKDRHAKYVLTVTNDGSVPNNNIRVAQTVGDGFKFVSADHNGKFEPSTKSVQWFVGRLEPGQTAQVSCELNAVALGDFSHTVSVLSDSGVRAEAKIETKVDGVASLTMELVDIDDPVEIGAETAYEIRVRNEGSKAASGVSLACELPPEMELINVKAPVDAIVEGRQILFKSLDQIAPGAQAVYRVPVKGVQEGTHRMRVRMTGASLTEPVVREEATKVYADSK
jgi:uncharacterized membrane protein